MRFVRDIDSGTAGGEGGSLGSRGTLLSGRCSGLGTGSSLGRSPRERTQVQGFSLVELMIVMAVAMLVIGFAVAWYQAELTRTARAELIEIQAKEMATLARALEQYLDNSLGLPETGGFDVSTVDMEAAGYLPPMYLRPSDALPAISPLGQVYVLRGMRHEGRYRGVVMPTGAPSEAQLSRYGIKGSADDLFAHAAKVMQRMESAHYATAGVMQVGATVTHSTSGFTADLSALLQNPAGPGAVVGLAGYAELSPFKDLIAAIELGDIGSGGAGGGGNPISTEGRACYMDQEGNACREGYESVWNYTACERWGPEYRNEPQTTSINIGGETIIITKSVERSANTYEFPADINNPVYWDALSYWSQGVGYNEHCRTAYTMYSQYCPTGSKHQHIYCEATTSGTGGFWINSFGQTSAPPPAGTICGHTSGGGVRSGTWAAGITESTRATTGMAPGHSGESFSITPAEAERADVVRHLPVCPGSTYAIPAPVHRLSEPKSGSQWREFISAEEGGAYKSVRYTENVKWAALSIDLTVTCSSRRVGGRATNVSNWLAPGVSAINSCPSATPPGQASSPGAQLFEHITPDNEKPRFRYCCST